MRKLLERFRDAELPLDELVAAAVRLVRQGGIEAEDGRVAAEIDVRTIRYYQTLGLLDKPHRFEGRRAVYGFRHLLQLLCIRKLQADGHPLAMIQQSMAARTTSQLEAALCEAMKFPGPAKLRSASRGLIAAELAPGVSIVIDPARVTAPDDLLKRIQMLVDQAMQKGTTHDHATE